MASDQKSLSRWAIVLCCLAATIGAAAYLFYFDTYHFAVVEPGVLYRTGMRSTRELQNTLRRVHPKTVVCLVTDREVNDSSKGIFRGEFQILREDRITLERIPMREDHAPTQEQIDEFLRIVNDQQNQPVMVHCAQGVIRTGMMVAVYERSMLGFTRQQALDAVKIFGKGEERADEVRQFINQYYNQQNRQVAAKQ